MPKLEKWSVMIFSGPYTPPEARVQRLHGTLGGDDRLSPSSGEPLEGKEVTTSRLVSIDLKARTAQTKNTLYELGTPDPEYAAWVKENEPDKYDDLVSVKVPKCIDCGKELTGNEHTVCDDCIPF